MNPDNNRRQGWTVVCFLLQMTVLRPTPTYIWLLRPITAVQLGSFNKYILMSCQKTTCDMLVMPNYVNSQTKVNPLARDQRKILISF